MIFNDPRLKDLVADNLALDDFTTEGEEILFGSNFGIVTHIQTGSDGALYLVSPSAGSDSKRSRRGSSAADRLAPWAIKAPASADSK